MSFCLVGNPYGALIDIRQKDIAFVKVVQSGVGPHWVMVLSREGELQLYDFSTGVKMYESRLLLLEETVKGILHVQEAQGVLYFITYPSIYLLPLTHFITFIKKGQAIELNRLRMISKRKQQVVHYGQLMSKRVKLYQQDGSTYLKLSGRTKSTLVYYYSRLELAQTQAQLIFSYQQTINNQLNVSLNSIDPDVILFQSYCYKAKPIKISILQFIPYLQSEKGADHMRRQIEVLHFSQQLTVIEVFKISENSLCIFGSNSFEGEGVSFMIVYNFREGGTLNYLNFNNAVIDRVVAFFPSGISSSSKELTFTFDGFASEDKYSHYYQLQPRSYSNEKDCLLKGKVVTSDKDYIICSTGRHLFVHPKIHKKAIYSNFLIHAKAENSQIPLILSLLQ